MRRPKLFPTLVAVFVLMIAADVSLLIWRSTHGWRVDPFSLLVLIPLILAMLVAANVRRSKKPSR